MNLKELNNELQIYIEQEYLNESTSTESISEFISSGLIKGKSVKLSNKTIKTLDNLINDVGETFTEYLLRKISESGKTEVDIYKRANMDRKLFSKIRNNPAYHPRKNTVLLLAIALELNWVDTKELLERAEYAMSPSNKGDLIIKFFIEHNVHDIQTINDALSEYKLPLLE